MPKLAGVADSLESVPEAYRSNYEEKDGKFYLKEVEFEESAPLKDKLAKKEKAINEANQKLGRYSKLQDADDDELNEFLETWAKRNEQPPPKDGKGDPDQQAKQLELKEKLHVKELKKRDDQITVLTTERDSAGKELREFKLWTPLREIAIKNGLNPEDWELARLDLANQGRFGFDEDGKLVVMEEGSPSPVTPEKFFKEVYTDQRPKFYKASNAGGSGASNDKKGGGGGKTITRERFEALSQSERMKISKEGVQIVD